MGLQSFLDNKWKTQTKQLSEKERKFFDKFYTTIWTTYNFVKPFLIATAMFWLAYRLKARLGYDDALFVFIVLIVVFLRQINGKLKH